MNESQLATYYDDQKARGSAAYSRKQGLGFVSDGSAPPQAPVRPHPPRKDQGSAAAAPTLRMPMPGMPSPGYGHLRPPPYGVPPPYPGVPLPPGAPPSALLRGPLGWPGVQPGSPAPPRPPAAAPAAPPPPAPGPSSATATPAASAAQPVAQPAQAFSLAPAQPAQAFSPAAAQQRAPDAPPAAAAAEVVSAPVPEEKSAEAEAQRQREAAAWSAYKSDSGQVYYYNTLTSESAWTKPEGFQGDAERASAQPTPVATERVRGTAWSQVTCDDGKKYYYNTKSMETSWTVPPEVAATQSEDAKEAATPAAAAAALLVHGSAAANGAGDRADAGAEDVTFTAEDIWPAALAPRAADEAAPAPLPPPKPQAEVEAEFRELLEEKGVTPFSRWERELPKLVTDDRWRAVASMKQRRQLFDSFCKAAADGRKRTRPGRGRSAQEAFCALLDEAAAPRPPAPAEEERGGAGGLSADATLESLELEYGEDPRWQACEEESRRELLEARLAPLRKAAEQDAQAALQSAGAGFRALLAETGVGAGARWSKAREDLAGEPRFQAVPRGNREGLFRAYVAEQDAAEVERVEREEREAAARKRAGREAEEADKRRRRAAHADAVAAFRALLGETVKDPDAAWSAWRPRLQRDPQGRASNPALDDRECVALFREHVDEMHKRAVASFTDLLDEAIRPLLPRKAGGEQPAALGRFADAERVLQDDARFSRVPEREREKLWRRYVEDIVLERDNPEALARRARMGGRTIARPMTRDVSAVTDKAYEREYLEPDRKRLRRD
ncbi:hypothetical protein WJX81_007697 [Elliptochloris bilobata]|uniref:Uncharacterized protein n=1 Tax=Elliptochloris bilobata TaxID=381761 RepID=A0AAW1QLR6_9CHLO